MRKCEKCEKCESCLNISVVVLMYEVECESGGGEADVV